MTTEYTVWDYVLGTLICLIPLFTCAFIPVFVTVGGITWLGKARRIFTIPSKRNVIAIFQAISITLLSATILAYLEVQIIVTFDNCFEGGSECPYVDDKFLFNTVAQIEGTIRNLLPPPMQNNCYTGHDLA